jgi:hypothetical protein
MKTILKIRSAGVLLLAACAAQAQTLTYSNSITVTGGNPPTAVAFDIPQFNPADGTLTSVTVDMYANSQYNFTYNGAFASGTLQFKPADSLSFLYNGSDVLAQDTSPPFTITAGLPSTGQAYSLPSPPSSQGESLFTLAPDLANFTGTGEAPLSAENDFDPTVTWTSGTVTWSATGSATMVDIVTYDFTVAPEPGVISLACAGGVLFAFHRCRYWRKAFARSRGRLVLP